MVKTRSHACLRNIALRVTGSGIRNTAEEKRSLSGEPATSINANQIESRAFEARSQINRIKAS